MKLCFSTVGCPDLEFREILSLACDSGYDGIEIRGIEGEVFAPNMPIFKESELALTIEKLKKANIEIPILDTALRLGDDCIKSAEEYLALAKILSCKYIRMYAHGDEQKIIENLGILSGKSGETTILLETKWDYADSAKMRALVSRFDNVGVLWDIHHTHRGAEESYEQTLSNIGDYIRHIHYKDSIIKDGDIFGKVPGEGDLPAALLVSLLKERGYGGYISLEWMLRWNRDLEDSGIVFAMFPDYFRNLWNKN